MANGEIKVLFCRNCYNVSMRNSEETKCNECSADRYIELNSLQGSGFEFIDKSAAALRQHFTQMPQYQ